MKTYEGFLNRFLKKKVDIEELKIGDYIAYNYPLTTLPEFGKIVNIKLLMSAGNFHKGKLFFIQTEDDIQATALRGREIRFLTKDEIEELDMKINTNKYNL